MPEPEHGNDLHCDSPVDDPERANTRLRFLRIVVVDDCPEFLEIVCNLLETEGSIQVVGRANDGAEALDAVAEYKPDVLLMDVNMPYLDGLASAAIVLKLFPATSIVLMSAENSPELQRRCKACGVLALISKSSLIEALMAALQPI